MSKKNKKFSTRSIHKGQVPEKLYGAVSLPIHLTSTFRQKEFGEYEYDYSRAGNPTRTNLETNIASLEEGKEAIANMEATLMGIKGAIAQADWTLGLFKEEKPK